MRKNGLKRMLVTALAGLLLMVFALPAFAASENVEKVLAQLAQLQNADISYEWPPDVQAHQGLVQALLDDYTACSAAERAEFTDQQLKDLRGYFDTLYTIQGKDTGELDALFTAGGGTSSSSSSTPEPSSSQPPPEPPAPPVSSSAPAVSSSSVPQSSTSLPGTVVAPESSSGGGTSLPTISNGPQTPANEGWLALFGNSALGVVLLVLLLGLVAVLFIRFLVSLRRAGRVPQQSRDEEFQNQELFGDSYDPGLPDARLDDLAEDAPQAAYTAPARPGGRTLPKTAPPREEDEETAPAPQVIVPPEKSRASRALNQKVATARTARDAELAAEEEREDTPAAAETPPQEETKGFFARRRAGKAAPPKAEDAPEKIPDAAEEEAATKTAPPRRQAQSARTHDPDKPNSITLKGFGAQPRTGRPNRMPFRQGDPDDIDGVDE